MVETNQFEIEKMRRECIGMLQQYIKFIADGEAELIPVPFNEFTDLWVILVKEEKEERVRRAHDRIGQLKKDIMHALSINRWEAAQALIEEGVKLNRILNG